MAEPDPVRAMEINGTLQLESAAIEARLKKIEEKLDGKKEKADLSWLLDILKTLLPSIVLTVIGFYLNDTVEQAMKEHQLQIDAVNEMQKIAEGLQGVQTRPDALAKAAQLAAFGRYSVPFFVNVLETGTQNSQIGAEDGLRMVARSEPQPVCSALHAVIRNRSGLYQWQTHASALKVLGQTGCVDACTDVAKYRNSLTSVNDFKPWVSNDKVMADDYKTVVDQASTTLEQLKKMQESNNCN